MEKNQPFNPSTQRGLQTNRLEGARRKHSPYFKQGLAANADPGEYIRTAIKTSRNEIPDENAGAIFCSFGQMVRVDGAPGIRGGLILCGDKNFNVTNYEIDGAADGEKVIFIAIPCEANMDDDQELILPGIKTSSAASITAADWNVADVYPVNTNPTVAYAGIGEFIFPLGTITITDGVASNFAPTGCGTCTITQCAGTLSHTRG